MLQSGSPEMMTPEQIEVADRAIEQLGEGFTLRPRGVTDNVFFFDPTSEAPPHRAGGQPADPAGEVRCFGGGTGYDALERLCKQLATTRGDTVKAFGKDIALHVQVSALRHLLAFWGQACPYSPPTRSPATGTLRIIHGFAQIWQHLSSGGSAKS